MRTSEKSRHHIFFISSANISSPNLELPQPLKNIGFLIYPHISKSQCQIYLLKFYGYMVSMLNMVATIQKTRLIPTDTSHSNIPCLNN